MSTQSSKLQKTNRNMRRLIGAFSLAALVLIIACAQTTDVDNSGGSLPTIVATPTSEPIQQPVTAVKYNVETAAADAQSAPQPTLAAIEARPTPEPLEARDPETIKVLPESTPAAPEQPPDSTPISSSNATSASTPTPAPTAPVPPAPADQTSSETSQPVPAAASPVKSTATPTPTPTVAPALPSPTPTPPPPTQPAARTAAMKPNPTPRPTPGPITRQTQFVPLDEPKYVSRDQASANITNASYVLGVVSNGESRAYPLDMMWYHHIANDTIGGKPWLITS